MARQGWSLQEKEIQRILQLLAVTDMTIGEIAERSGCSRGAIASLNRRYQVRDYAGHRSTWTLTPAYQRHEEVA